MSKKTHSKTSPEPAAEILETKLETMLSIRERPYDINIEGVKVQLEDFGRISNEGKEGDVDYNYDHGQVMSLLAKIENGSKRKLLTKAWQLVREMDEFRKILIEKEYAFSKLELLLEIEKELLSQQKAS